MSTVITKLTVTKALSQPSVLIGFPLSIALYVSFFFGAQKSKIATSEKQVSWLLTFMSSAGLTLASIPRFYNFWRSGWDIRSFQVDNTFDTMILCYFVTYLILDLTLGSIYYKGQINLLTGWIHHSVYTFMTVYFLCHRLGGFFVVASILELPTLIMALGCLWSNLRSDYLFASTFFSFRLVFHAFMIKTLKQHHHIQTLWIVAASIFPLHLFWFYGFIRQQKRKYQVYMERKRAMKQKILEEKENLQSVASCSTSSVSNFASKKEISRLRKFFAQGKRLSFGSLSGAL
ncbi:hypothetical protein INT43_007265 [Umbelopsis isabellina]|uniref:TLC domain-containing protein n=1 Tax=Mortierella isabellina TaxID=91625 RepID=A0A8H7PYP7_MORIS|nr:hypothetical protein INT43_007265 [Umbelopsis isabellina]